MAKQKTYSTSNNSVKNNTASVLIRQTQKKNFNKALTNLISPLHTQPTNTTFHNLCITQQLPPGSRQLLGLN
jgi:hypothetical protein